MVRVCRRTRLRTVPQESWKSETRRKERLPIVRGRLFIPRTPLLTTFNIDLSTTLAEFLFFDVYLRWCAELTGIVERISVLYSFLFLSKLAVHMRVLGACFFLSCLTLSDVDAAAAVVCACACACVRFSFPPNERTNSNSRLVLVARRRGGAGAAPLPLLGQTRAWNRRMRMRRKNKQTEGPRSESASRSLPCMLPSARSRR